MSLKSIEKSYQNGTIEFIGVVQNKGKVDWENLEIEIEVFSKDGKFIDELNRRLSVNLSPGESEYFKISAKEYPESKWNLISDVKAKIADAYHSRY